MSSSEEIRNIRADIADAPIVTVTGGGTTAYLHRVRLYGHGDGWGVTASSGAVLYADNAQILQNNAGGINLISNATGYVRNTMVGAENNTNAIGVTSSTVDMLYSTLVGNFGTSFGLSCNPGSTVTIRNSIVVGRSDDISCAAATLTNSASLDEAGAYDEMWFDLDGGDLTLAGSTGDFQDVAVWMPGDPPFDFEGDTRPNEDGAMDYAGADVP